jgi:alkylation response protein AidB-like acyl-CoA dehydrogenase
MDFDFTDEQNQIRDQLAKYLAAEYDFDKRRALIAAPDGWRTPWKTFAELGLLAAPLPETYGGLGGGAQDVLVIQEEFGKALVVSPFVPTVVIGAGLIARIGSEAQKQAHLPAIAEGSRVIAFAHSEPNARYNLADIELNAKKQGAGWVLNGQKAVVLSGPEADHLVVTARTGGARREERGVSLFVLPKNAKGVSTRDYLTVDGARASDIYFENVALGDNALLGAEGEGFAPLVQAMDEAIAALCAEAIGVMRSLHEQTLAYVKERKQFGVAIGSFQVNQHRLVDMFMALELATSSAYLATLKVGADAKERSRAASAAKVQICKSAHFLGQSAIQLWGGMGMTDEVRASHYFKRLTMIESQFGDLDHHVRRFIALG